MTIETLISTVCRAYHDTYPGAIVTPGDVMGSRRFREFTVCRQISMYLMREAGMSFTAIAGVFGMNHATVIHACRTIAGIVEIRAEEGAVVAKATRELLNGGMSIPLPESTAGEVKEAKRWMRAANMLRGDVAILRAEVLELKAELGRLQRVNSRLGLELLLYRNEYGDEDVERMPIARNRPETVKVYNWTPEEKKELDELRKTHKI